MEGRDFHEKLKAAEALIGIVLRSSDPVMAELVAAAGFDFGWIDMEHAPLSLRDVQAAIIALRLGGCAPLVRVPSHDPNLIGQVLDMGALIVNVPHVESAAQAQEIVRAARFSPLGSRGFSSTTRANRFGREAPTPESFARQNRENLVMVQIESRMGMDQLEKIAEVDGVDILFLGTGDLSHDLGVAGQASHPLVRDAVKHFVECAREAGKPAALPIGSLEALREHRALGYTVFSCGVDLALFRATLEGLAKSFRSESQR